MAENDLSYGACFAVAPSLRDTVEMRRSATVCLEVCAFVFIAVSHSYDLKIKTRNLQGK